MERYTHQYEGGLWYVETKYLKVNNGGNEISGLPILKLAEYENTGLDPAEIESLKMANEFLRLSNNEGAKLFKQNQILKIALKQRAILTVAMRNSYSLETYGKLIENKYEEWLSRAEKELGGSENDR